MMTCFFNYVFFIVIFPNEGVWDFSMANVDRDTIFHQMGKDGNKMDKICLFCNLCHFFQFYMYHLVSFLTFFDNFLPFLHVTSGACSHSPFMERKMRIAGLMSECVEKEIGKCLQSSKWKKPKQGRASQAIHDIFAIPSSGVYCILSNLPFYFYLF